MLGPWMTVACRSTLLRHSQRIHGDARSGAPLLRRGLAMLHAADARAVDDSCPLSYYAVICASSAMLARSRVRSLFVFPVVVLVLVVVSRVLHILISEMESRSRTIMPMSMLHIQRRGPFSHSISHFVVVIAVNVQSRYVSPQGHWQNHCL